MIKIDSSELNKFSIYLKTKSVEDEKKIKKLLKNTGMKIEASAKDNLTNNKSVDTGHLRQGIFNIRSMNSNFHVPNVSSYSTS